MKTRHGFTIIELLTVMVIITILAGFVFTVGKRAKEMALINRVKTDMAALEAAINQYKADTGVFPKMINWPTNQFKAHLEDGYMPGPAPLQDQYNNDVIGWKGPYMHFKDEDLIESPPKSFADPWGTMYFYWMPGDPAKNDVNYFDLWSAGPDTDSDDAIPSTLVDDINNW